LIKTSLALLTMISIAVACSTPPKTFSCSEGDWFERGRADGLAGKVRNMTGYRVLCGKQLDANAESLYTGGYNNGINEYCSAANGFAIGLADGRPSTACPVPLDHVFNENVNRGREARRLKDNNQKISREISSLSQKISGSKEKPSAEGLRQKLQGLEKQLLANRKRIYQIESQLD
jgi:hypothetical protein